MKIWDRLISKNYWISTIIIVISVMLFQNKVSGYIASKITLPQIILTAFALIIIVVISRVITEEILEI